MEQANADKYIKSTMSAYGGMENALKPLRQQVKGASKDYSQLQSFVDMANYAGNNFAVTTEDIGIAMQQSSSALKTNGVTMEENIGMIIAMNETLQDSGKTGNALKSIGSNMAGVRTS